MLLKGCYVFRDGVCFRGMECVFRPFVFFYPCFPKGVKGERLLRIEELVELNGMSILGDLH